MKTLSTSDQIDLQSFIQGLKDNSSINWSIEEQGFLSYWAIELKPKRVRKLRSSEDGALAPKKQNILDTEEGVIEQAYRDHTGGL